MPRPGKATNSPGSAKKSSYGLRQRPRSGSDDGVSGNDSSLNDSRRTNILDVTGDNSPQAVFKHELMGGEKGRESKSKADRRAGRQSDDSSFERPADHHGADGSNLYPDLSDMDRSVSGSPSSSFQRYRRSPQQTDGYKGEREGYSGRRQDYRPPTIIPESNVYEQDTFDRPGARKFKGPQRRRGREGDSGKYRNKDQDSERNILVSLAVCLLIAVFLFLYFGWFTTSPDVSTATEEKSVQELRVEHFGQEVNILKRGFPAQDVKFWRVVKAATKRVLKEANPDHPAIILLASEAGGDVTVGCLAKKLARIISETYKTETPSIEFRYDHRSYASKEEGKIALDDTLKDGFQSGSKVGLIRNLHEIPGKVAMMLHAYCDNENAPFKDVALLLTMQAPMGDLGLTLREKEAENHLNRTWIPDLNEDSLSALLSRVANNIAVVTAETRQALQSVGC